MVRILGVLGLIFLLLGSIVMIYEAIEPEHVEETTD